MIGDILFFVALAIVVIGVTLIKVLFVVAACAVVAGFAFAVVGVTWFLARVAYAETKQWLHVWWYLRRLR